MKWLVSVPTVLMLFSCQEDEIAKAENNEIKNSISTIIDTDTIIRIDLTKIKSNAQKGMTSFDMKLLFKKMEIFKALDTILSNQLVKMNIDNNPKWRLTYYQEYEPLLYYQWEENEEYFWFTILQRDESCCFTMYMVIANQKGELRSLNCLALYGGDAGWTENWTGNKLYLGTYKMESISQDAADFLKDSVWYSKVEYEHTFTKVSVKNGLFEKDSLSSVFSDTTFSYH